MSSVPYRYVGPKFERERYEEVDKVAQWLYEVDNAPDERGFRSKIKSFWKRTRINAVVRNVMERSKDLLIRLASGLTNDGTPPESNHSWRKTAARASEQVKFPDDNAGSAAASTASTASTASPVVTPTPLESEPSDIPNLTYVPSNPEDPTTFAQSILDTPVSLPETGERSFSAFRYKEEKRGKQLNFPEIELGVVSVRVKWLEPLFSGEKGSVQALEKQDLGELAPNKDGRQGDQFPKDTDTESDDESAFDDSPRLFKHRLPEEEPKPWVEPGTVARGAMWLHPVLSGAKRASSRNNDQGNLESPTRVSHGMFR